MSSWDRLRGYLTTRIRKDWNYRRLLETVPALRWLDAKPGERILDIGCGDGTYDYRIARRGARVFGFDINHRQLVRAMTHHQTAGSGFFRADASLFPVRAGQFDTVISLCVFEHLPNDGATLREAWRTLRPNGRLLLTLDSLSHDGVDDAWRTTHRARHAVRQFYTHQTITELFQRSGFIVRRYRYLVRSGLDLWLIRLSYATERMNAVSAFIVRTWLITAGRVLSACCNAFSSRDRGWTLLVEGTKQTILSE